VDQVPDEHVALSVPKDLAWHVGVHVVPLARGAEHVPGSEFGIDGSAVQGNPPTSAQAPEVVHEPAVHVAERVPEYL
jgi:hypothetical protein